MATLLVHIIDPRKTAGASLTAALDDIEQNHRLVANQGTWGYGIYAWHAGRVPVGGRSQPMVVFEVDDGLVKTVGSPAQPFAFIRIRIGQPYFGIRFLGFLN